MKKFFLVAFFLLLPFSFNVSFQENFFVNAASIKEEVKTEKAEEEKITIYFFDDRLCPVCKSAKTFIESILEDYPQVNLEVYPILDIEKLNEVAKKHNVEEVRVMSPTIFIGDNFFQFRDFSSHHEDLIIRAVEGELVENDCCVVKIPFLNIEVDIRHWSLPLITILLASLDGLNVCSIGALILILSIVMFFNSKRKIFLFGGIYLVVATTVYGSMVFLWGKVIESFLGHLETLRILVGIASFLGGVYFLKEFWRFYKYGPTCSSSNSFLAKKATTNLQESFNSPKKDTLLLAASVAFFSVAITIIELPCSVGLPVVFTGILVEKQISLLSYFLYILLYLFFYMLIEIVIFLGAVFTKKIWLTNSKMITWISLFGALVLFYLSFYYLFS